MLKAGTRPSFAPEPQQSKKSAKRVYTPVSASPSPVQRRMSSAACCAATNERRLDETSTADTGEQEEISYLS